MCDAHNPDTNPNWTSLQERRIYACQRCGTEKEVSTNHTGTVWAERCAGSCRQILNPNTAREIVLPYHGPHKFVRKID